MTSTKLNDKIVRYRVEDGVAIITLDMQDFPTNLMND